MNSTTAATPEQDQRLLAQVTEVARAVGARTRELFSPDARPADRADLITANRKIEHAAEGLQAALAALRPQAQWLDDNPDAHRDTRPMHGEWWVTDSVEGAVNFLHGLAEFSINITLIRDNQPALAVVHQPVQALTYTAVRGAGAHLDGRRLRVSGKRDLSAAIATTSQGGGGADLNKRTAAAIETMLNQALLVRQSVPSTFPLLAVAAGHFDLYWRYGPDLPALAPGVLLATEAGATATDTHGNPWQADSTDLILANPKLHPAALSALSALSALGHAAQPAEGSASLK